MYTIQPKKLMIINILDILKKYTDENHRLSQKDIVDMHHDFDSKFIERICREYDLSALENHITDLDTMFRMKFNRGYSTRFAEKQLGITSDENDDWRHLDIAGKVFIVLQGE